MPQPEPPDSADADALRELVRSRGWRLVLDRIGDEVERKRRELEGDLDATATARARGAISAYRTAAEIPSILIREIQEGVSQ